MDFIIEGNSSRFLQLVCASLEVLIRTGLPFQSNINIHCFIHAWPQMYMKTCSRLYNYSISSETI